MTGTDESLPAGGMSPIAQYLWELNRHLVAGLHRRAALLQEVADHLGESACALEDSGMAPADAQREAIARFGPAAEVAASLGADLPARAEHVASAWWRLYDSWRARHPWLGTLALLGLLALGAGVGALLLRPLVGDGPPSSPHAHEHPALGVAIWLAGGAAAFVVLGLRARTLLHRPEPGLSARVAAWRSEHSTWSEVISAMTWIVIGGAETLSTGRISPLLLLGVGMVGSGGLGWWSARRRRAGRAAPGLRVGPFLPPVLMLIPLAVVLGHQAWVLALAPIIAWTMFVSWPVTDLRRWGDRHPMLDSAVRAVPAAALMIVASMLGAPPARVPLAVLTVAMAVITVFRGLIVRAGQRSALDAALIAGDS